VNVNRGIWFRLAQAQIQDPIQKIIKAKRARGEAQVVETLLSKCKVLSSNPTATKNKKKN
jgi:hypothetical protein